MLSLRKKVTRSLGSMEKLAIGFIKLESMLHQSPNEKLIVGWFFDFQI